MMKLCFCLADCVFQLNGEGSFFSDFSVQQSDSIVSTINEIQSEDTLPTFFGVEIREKVTDFVLRDSEYGDIVCADSAWENIDFYNSAISNPQKAVLLSAIYSRLCFENVLLCHASLVDYNGYGILFVGPSGIGKTTQAELWRKYKGAEIINGDKAFLKMEDKVLRGYGLPWKGSSEYCLNCDVKIDAVVALSQDKANSINKVTEEEKNSLFTPHVFLPHWDEKCMKSALETLNKVLNTVPVYLLKCRPDEEAVRLTETTVLG